MDFKNLKPEVEKALDDLLKTLKDSALLSIDRLSVSPDKVTICGGEKELTMTQMRKEIENMTPDGIEHIRGMYKALETIVRIRSESKKKSFLSKFKFW